MHAISRCFSIHVSVSEGRPSRCRCPAVEMADQERSHPTCFEHVSSAKESLRYSSTSKESSSAPDTHGTISCDPPKRPATTKGHQSMRRSWIRRQIIGLSVAVLISTAYAKPTCELPAKFYSLCLTMICAKAFTLRLPAKGMCHPFERIEGAPALLNAAL